MFIFLSIIIVLLAVLLTFIVTIQNSKGGGLASGFASSNQIMGVRKTTDLLEKVTWGLIGSIVVLSIFATRYSPSGRPEQRESTIQDMVKNTPMPTPVDTQPFATTPAPEEPVAPDQPAE